MRSALVSSATWSGLCSNRSQSRPRTPAEGPTPAGTAPAARGDSSIPFPSRATSLPSHVASHALAAVGRQRQGAWRCRERPGQGWLGATAFSIA
eukprot:1704859-Pleurochrysis_carterae.AAC.1